MYILLYVLKLEYLCCLKSPNIGAVEISQCVRETAAWV